MASPARAISWTEIANRALARLGQGRIDSIDDSTQPAVLCRTFLEESVNLVAAHHPWRCTLTRLELARDVAVPAFGWTYQYMLPADFLTLSRDDLGPLVADEDDDRTIAWEIEGQYLLTDSETLYIVYHRTPSTPLGLLPAMVSAITYTLAWKLAPVLTASDSMTAQIAQEQVRRLQESVSADSACANDPSACSERGYKFADEMRSADA